MKNKINSFLKSEIYETIKDNFIEAIESGYLIDLKMNKSPDAISESTASLCDAFLYNCLMQMPHKQKVEETTPAAYYTKWVDIIKNITPLKPASFQEEINKLENTIEKAGNNVYYGLGEEATTKQKEEAINSTVTVFFKTVQFLIQINLNPVEILLQSIFDCGMEEYGAMNHLTSNILYGLNLSIKAPTFLTAIQHTDTETYDEIIAAICAIWGTFNIFHAKKNMCSITTFENKLLEVIKKQLPITA